LEDYHILLPGGSSRRTKRSCGSAEKSELRVVRRIRRLMTLRSACQLSRRRTVRIWGVPSNQTYTIRDPETDHWNGRPTFTSGRIIESVLYSLLEKNRRGLRSSPSYIQHCAMHHAIPSPRLVTLIYWHERQNPISPWKLSAQSILNATMMVRPTGTVNQASTGANRVAPARSGTRKKAVPCQIFMQVWRSASCRHISRGASHP